MPTGRSKCVMKGVNQKVISHDEFIGRIRKSLYFGAGTLSDDMEISRPLAEYASELFSEPHKGHSLQRLNTVTAGNMHTSPCSLIMALIYLDRLNATDPNYVRRISPSELFVVSMMISTKFYSGYDEDFYLSDWAKDSNLSEERLKKLELEFLCAIDWNIYISNNDFFDKLESVEKTLARREGLRRGWLTYGELINLLPSFTVAKFFVNNMTVLAVSYAASVITIAGAFFIASQIPGSAFNRKDLSSSTESGTKTLPNEMLNSNIETANNSNKNRTCSAINIEEELEKLENQYIEEALLDEIHAKRNENTGPLINFNQNYLIPHPRVHLKGTGINWQSFKDDNDPGGNDSRSDKDECIDSTNCTGNFFWNLVVDAEKSLIQIPFVWFKFM